MTLTPLVFMSTDVPKDVYEAVKPYESKFGLRFSRFYVFSKSLFTEIHSPCAQAGEKSRLVVASDYDRKLLEIFSVLTEIANSITITPEMQKIYFDALVAIYHRLPRKPNNGPGVLTISPEREGKVLAQRMGWFAGSALDPNLKRIPYKSGLVVGINGLDIQQSFEECCIIDGAIASGATLITIMHSLKDFVRSFHIYSVHAAVQGLNALFHTANYLNVDLSITVGHTTDGLNYKYYATVKEQSNLVQVGDLGDIIAPL